VIKNTDEHLLLTSRVSKGKRKNKYRKKIKSTEDKIHEISEDLSRGGLNNSTNSITSFTYYQFDFISVRHLQKVLLKGDRGLDVILFSFDVIMMVINDCFGLFNLDFFFG